MQNLFFDNISNNKIQMKLLLMLVMLLTGVLSLASPIHAQQDITWQEVQLNGVNSVAGLNGISDVTVSPDGKNVYTASFQSNAISAFTRSATDGTLTFLETHANGNGTITSLLFAFGVTVSPDGNNIYAVSPGNNAVVAFTRNSTTGALTLLAEYISGANSIVDLNGPVTLSASPDGLNIYAVTGTSDSIVVFTRNTTTGALTFLESHLDTANNGLSQGFNATSSPINNIAISSDNAFFYVTSTDDNSVSMYTRNTTTGALTFSTLYVDDAGGFDGLQGASSLVLSPDGTTLYVSGQLESKVAALSRNTTTGLLTFLEVQTDGTGSITLLGGARSLAMAPDGKSLFVSALNDNAIVTFTRNSTTGALTFSSELADGATQGSNTVNGLAGVSGMVTDPNSGNLYAAGQGDAGLAVLRLKFPGISLASSSGSYTAGTLTLDSSLTVSDGDSTNLSSAVISVSTNFLSGDTLAATTTGTSITSSFNATTGVLTLSGSDTLANYQTVLRTVTYSFSGSDTTKLTRTLTFQPTDSDSNVGFATPYTLAIITPPDTTAPVISQVTAVATPSASQTPNYVFASDEAGTISYGGSCTSTTTAAVVGNNTIIFSPLAYGTYTGCNVTVTDSASNASNVLTVPPFTIEVPLSITDILAVQTTTAATTTTLEATTTTIATTTAAPTTTVGVATTTTTTPQNTVATTSTAVVTTTIPVLNVTPSGSGEVLVAGFETTSLIADATLTSVSTNETGFTIGAVTETTTADGLTTSIAISNADNTVQTSTAVTSASNVTTTVVTDSNGVQLESTIAADSGAVLVTSSVNTNGTFSTSSTINNTAADGTPTTTPLNIASAAIGTNLNLTSTGAVNASVTVNGVSASATSNPDGTSATSLGVTVTAADGTTSLVESTVTSNVIGAALNILNNGSLQVKANNVAQVVIIDPTTGANLPSDVDLIIETKVDGQVNAVFAVTDSGGRTIETTATSEIAGTQATINSDGSISTAATTNATVTDSITGITATVSVAANVTAASNGQATATVQVTDSTGQAVTTTAISEILGAKSVISNDGTVAMTVSPTVTITDANGADTSRQIDISVSSDGTGAAVSQIGFTAQDGSKITTSATSSIAGANTVIVATGSVETNAPAVTLADGTTTEAVVVIGTNGEAETFYRITDPVTGTVTLERTSDASTPFEANSTVNIKSVNGNVIVETEAVVSRAITF